MAYYIYLCNNSDFCVVAPGMTMLEMLAINKDLYLYSLTSEHQYFASFLERNNIAYKLSSFPIESNQFVRGTVSGRGCLNLIEKII